MSEMLPQPISPIPSVIDLLPYWFAYLFIALNEVRAKRSKSFGLSCSAIMSRHARLDRKRPELLPANRALADIGPAVLVRLLTVRARCP